LLKTKGEANFSLGVTLKSEMFVVYLQRIKTNTIMSEAELVLVEKSKELHSLHHPVHHGK